MGPEMRPGAQAGEAAMPMNREQGLTAGGDVWAAKNLLVLKGEPRRRPIFTGKELAGGRWPPDPEGNKRSGGREEREHEESRIAAAVIIS